MPQELRLLKMGDCTSLLLASAMLFARLYAKWYKSEMADKEKKTPTVEIPLERMFLASQIIPDATEAFLSSSENVKQVKDEVDVVLDTNALLLPYGSGSESLDRISALYKKLVTAKRLFIPAQASREFVRNRPNKISELQQGLLDKMSSFSTPDVPSYPILEGLPEYAALLEALQAADELRKKVRKATNGLVDVVRNWEWNDPVSVAYRRVIVPEVIVECEVAQEHIRSEMSRRYDLLIPPGYKDAAKEDGGVGDFLIWKTILQIGAQNKRPLIFVSGDEKPDWQYSAKGNAFLPRVELVTEYRAASGGKTFFMIPLSRLLELFEGESSSVVELKQAEERLNNKANVDVHCPNCSTLVHVHLGLALGSSAAPLCPACRKRFHVNRSRDGVLAKLMTLPARKPAQTESSLESEEIVFCPNCQDLVELDLGISPGSAKWAMCGGCEARFPVRRSKDGSVQASSQFELES